ncbi:hypothetical protein FJV77_30920 [Mesorhizobium sp. WSM4306]|nr:hypothetical protein FJV77_30920 [Mesorhizobium sp. WSM4306]
MKRLSRGSSLLLPVTIRGEVPGRAMRGSADSGVCPPQKSMIRRTRYIVAVIEPCLEGWRCPSSGCRHLLPV